MIAKALIRSLAARYATESLIRIVYGDDVGQVLGVNFSAGFEIGIGLALVDPDLARRLVDDAGGPQTHAEIAAAVEAVRRAAT